MKVSRRTFIKVAGGAAAGSILMAKSAWAEPSLKSLTAVAEAQTVGGEKWVSTLCQQCGAGCGIRVRVVKGMAVKIAGNPQFPTNQGRLCAIGEAGLQVLYDPDRIKWPLRRAGERGEGRWERLSWTEAMSEVAQRLGELRDRGEAHTVVLMRGDYHRLADTVFERFLRAYGSPNDIVHSSTHSNRSNGTFQANYFTQGVQDHLGYDWADVSYFLSFGAPYAEWWGNPVENALARVRMRHGHPGRLGKIVQVDTRLSLSAAKADEWVPIKPGTDGALALGLAHVIIKENLYDRGFVNTQTFGFEGWTDEVGNAHRGFRDLVMADYPPEKVSEITGVPVKTIVRLGKEFAAHRPAMAVGGWGVGGHTNGVYNLMAVQALNALVGAVGPTSSIRTLESPPLSQLPPISLDSSARKGLSMPRLDGTGTLPYPFTSSVPPAVMADKILKGEPYKVNALLLYYTNPLYSGPEVGKFHEAVKKVPFIVSFSPFMDEATEQADLVLPDCTYLERLEDQVIEPNDGAPVLGVRQPVVPPLYDTANSAEAIVWMAHRMGGAVREAFPWVGFEEMLKETIKGVFQAQSSSISAKTFEEFWEKLLENGVWWDKPARQNPASVFKTPSGKFEFYSQTMKMRLNEIAQGEASGQGLREGEGLEKILAKLKIAARGDEVYMPHYETERLTGDPKEYPFYLNPYRLVTLSEGKNGNLPWLLDISGVHVNMQWKSWAEINPRIAKKLGISNGDKIWIESPLGKMMTVAKLYEGAMPQVINVPLGFGHQAYGRWAKDRGANPYWILSNEHDQLSGAEGRFSTRVKVYKA